MEDPTKGAQGTRLPWRNFRNFYAIFVKILPDDKLVPPLSLDGTPIPEIL